MTYNLRKARTNALMIYLGVFSLKVAPYINLNTGDVDLSTLANLHWWRHTIVASFVITVFAEIKYIIKFLASLNGNGNGESNVNKTA